MLDGVDREVVISGRLSLSLLNPFSLIPSYRARYDLRLSKGKADRRHDAIFYLFIL